MASILGISAFCRDSSATLVVDGEVVAAAEEERFSRNPHESSFPRAAAEFCLERAGLSAAELDYVGFHNKPLLTFDRLLESFLATAPRGFGSFLKTMPEWMRNRLHLPREIRRGLGDRRRSYVFLDHHEAHAASAYFPSPFDRAAILTVDGVGEWATAAISAGEAGRIELIEQLDYPHSLGLLYSAFAYHCGFVAHGREEKLMGLAPFGQPRYADEILDKLMDLRPDGSFRLETSYFDFDHDPARTSERFHALFDGPPRRRGEPIQQRQMDLAASIQAVTEKILLGMATHARQLTGHSRLCLAGGVALNCVANGRLLREGVFDRIWVQPAAGDAGSSLGVALFIWHQLLGGERAAANGDSQKGSFLGPSYSESEIRELLDEEGVCYETISQDDHLCEVVAEGLAQGEVVGWVRGAMEFGPRALGARSILADARDPSMRRRINHRVKFRDGFQPFASAVLEEKAPEYFEVPPGWKSPYMLFTGAVHPQKRLEIEDSAQQRTGFEKLAVVSSEIPAVTHVDGSARLQTIDSARHGPFRQVLETFHRKTGCPVLVNSSFNRGWEPIVRTPREALRTFFSTGIDTLVVGRQVVRKRDQQAWVSERHLESPPDLCGAPWISPCCSRPLASEGDRGLCSACGQVYGSREGIARFYWPHDGASDPGDVTEKVRAFYEKTPFPDYDDDETVRSLINKSRQRVYARWLDEAIPVGASVLEVGCGTGQLSNFLGITCRRVIGTDLCLNSLKLGERFRRQRRLPQVRFAQMNLFRPCFRPGSFDVILCNGVLHHTSDPRGGFDQLWPLLKPGGRIVVGLYNRYGRLATHLRRGFFRLSGGRGRSLDPYLRKKGLSSSKRRAWFADQYQHPKESSHTMGEVLDWFRGSGLEFVNSVPTIAWSLDPPVLENGGLFEKVPPGSGFDRLSTQAKMVLTGSREGGFFVMIGQRPNHAHSAGGH